MGPQAEFTGMGRLCIFWLIIMWLRKLELCLSAVNSPQDNGSLTAFEA